MRRSAFLLSIFVAATACKPPKTTDLPLCKVQVEGSEADEVEGGDIDPGIWYLILLQNFNRETMVAARPIMDCSSREIKPLPAPEIAGCMAGSDSQVLLADRPFTEDDLQVEPIENEQQLVWVRTHHVDDGDALGPIGIAEWTKKGVAVRSLGTLRANPNKAMLRLEPMGKYRVLVVESRVCDPDNPKKCGRVLRMQPLVGDRFVDAAFVDVDKARTCIGPAKVQLFEEKEITLADGTLRRFEISRSPKFEDGVVTIAEQVVIKDSDPRQPDVPPKQFRKANLVRELHLDRAGIVTQPSLWDKMLGEHGSVEVRERKAELPDKPAGG